MSFQITGVIAALSLTLALGACDDAMTGGDTVEMFKYYGTTQCAPRENKLPELEAQLTAAGVQILDRREGDDGMMRAMVCGGSDGRIGVFTINAAQTGAAEAAGFEPYNGPN